MSRLAWICPFLLPWTLSWAQEVWIMPEKHAYHAGDLLKAGIFYGENLNGKPWDGSGFDLEQIMLCPGSKGLEGQLDKKKYYALQMPAPDGHISLLLKSKGTAVTHSLGDFDAFIKKYGWDALVSAPGRTKAGEGQWREWIIYNSYTVVTPLKGTVNTACASHDPGIVPRFDLSSAKVGDLVQFKLTWKSAPLFGVKVMVLNIKGSYVIAQPIYPSQDGLIDVRLGNEGWWMVRAIGMVPSKKEGVDWETGISTFMFYVN